MIKKLSLLFLSLFAINSLAVPLATAASEVFGKCSQVTPEEALTSDCFNVCCALPPVYGESDVFRWSLIVLVSSILLEMPLIIIFIKNIKTRKKWAFVITNILLKVLLAVAARPLAEAYGSMYYEFDPPLAIFLVLIIATISVFEGYMLVRFKVFKIKKAMTAALLTNFIVATAAYLLVFLIQSN